MQFPVIRRFQFLDQTSFNAAVQSLFANDVMLGSTLFMPGLVNANNLSVSESGLQVTVDLPHPFAVLFQTGVIATLIAKVKAAKKVSAVQAVVWINP